MKPAVNIPKPSYSFAKRHGLLVGQDAQGKILVMYRDSLKPQVVAELRRFIAKPFKLSKGETAEEFDKLLSSFYGDNQDTEAMMQDFGEELDLDEVAESLGESQDLLEAEDDAPIIRLINAILRQAIKENASDIHFETFENRLAVRLRVDGVLREILQPPRELSSLIVSRLKVMANLDIAEKRLPQDGRITRSIGGHVIDMRMSTLPSGPGERVVLRLLDRQAGRLDLAELGMPSETMEHINELIRRPHGIFLVTGPTGSGKTTTLYASLLQLNDNQRNILTVEDPIEYYLDGVGQTQVNNKVEMSFARGLRAILRQDPDVVMVGEIRDLETAEIGVQASLTGHMVFSTLHTNTAIGAVTRMRDMGVEPFLLSSTLVGVLAQRLVRKLCARCRYPEIATPLERKRMGMAEEGDPVHIYRPNGCEECSHTGYVGRTGIYELVVVDEALRQMIHDNASEYDMEKQARTITQGIREDGMAKVLDGVTTLEEVVRVTREF